MKLPSTRLAATMLVLLTGCGGGVFEAGLFTGDGAASADGGPDALGAEASVPDGDTADARGGEGQGEAAGDAPQATPDAGEASSDAGLDVTDAMIVETGPACTPFPSGDPATCGTMQGYAKPYYFFLSILPGCGGGGSSCGSNNAEAISTPAACQCQQTYNCGCIDLTNVCAAYDSTFVFASCNDSTGTPIVDCNCQ